jgi:hypothetical protein
MLAHFTGSLLVKMAVLSLGIWKSIWRTKTLFSFFFYLFIYFFTWLAAIVKILIVDNFSKWHVIVVDRCCMCKMNGESMEHLPLYCEVVYSLLNIIFNRFGLSWVMSSRVTDLFAHCGQVDVLGVLSVKDGTLLPLWCL